MTNRKGIVKSTTAIIALCSAPYLVLSLAGPAHAELHEPIKVVATFSVLGDMVERVGSTLYSDALSGQDEPAATYIDMMRHNATMLAQALDS